MCRAHGRISWCDDRHAVSLVTTINLLYQFRHCFSECTHSRVPDWMMHVWRTVLDLLQNHRLRPRPSRVSRGLLIRAETHHW